MKLTWQLDLPRGSNITQLINYELVNLLSGLLESVRLKKPLMPSSMLQVAEGLALPGAKHLPTTYTAPISTPTIPEVELSHGSIPIIDLEALHGPRRSNIVKQLGHACQHQGFFAVKNHGIPKRTVNGIFDTTREFFHLPVEERMKFHTPDPNSEIRLMTAYKDEVENLFIARESLKFHCHPVENYVNKWPTNPTSFRKKAAEYLTNVRRVELTLLDAISESLGLERDYIEKRLGGHYVSLNYYRACEQSDLVTTLGVRGHTDPTVITILLQDDVPGLQVLSEGKWMDVNPIPDTVVVHVGDLLQAISNYRYKSLLHQAVVNSDKERMSIASYCYPSSDAMIGPPKELIDNNNPAVYKDFTYGEFYKQMWKVITPTDKRLDSFKISAP
ncbi:unnamed protein product [Dovyalis caffra]|uniref:Fe2OG dioxygenase domain-containing protein n=1 Tax=Dovyalis caffra TaxID=77055 RepID=A0AAV1SWG2_9ROSI|nr:unnamed protein product [Dovyalis caffra]